MQKRALVIGGGVIGTMHCWQLLESGFEVTQLERSPIPQQASVRNFGLVWVGGRKAGNELAVALRARELWAALAAKAPQLTFRANGSLTVARNPQELEVLRQSVELPDAQLRGWQLLNPQQTKSLNPGLAGDLLGALHCSLDAAVEPGLVLGETRSFLSQFSQYSWQPNVDVVDVSETAEGVRALASDGKSFDADIAMVCPGADHETLFAGQLAEAPLRRVRLQMFSTKPLDATLTTSIADGDSLRYYPAYDVPALADLPAQSKVAADAKIQLLLVQRSDGTLTIGDTHEYDEPFDFALREPEYDYLIGVAESVLGRSLPKVERRWSGVYSQRTDGAVCDRQFVSKKIVVVTGPGGRGNSLAPAIAEQTLIEWGI